MDRDRILETLQAVANQELSAADAMERLRHLPFEDLGFAKLDLHRSLRQGMAEVIFCPGKTAKQVADIAVRLSQHHNVVLASRATPNLARGVLQSISEQPAGEQSAADAHEQSVGERSTSGQSSPATYHELAQMLVFGPLPQPDESLPKVAVVTAGTADLPVAEEAALVLQAHAVPVIRINDVGVAGIHRLLGNLDTLKRASLTIVVAGMDGALPSVIAGLLPGPVIAVPTSVGYGASFQGMAALLTMLNSCAAGLTVVNIDNGFGAAAAALRLLQSLPAQRLESAEAAPDAQRHKQT